MLREANQKVARSFGYGIESITSIRHKVSKVESVTLSRGQIGER